jgi:FixJ family two-component response regulator
MRQRRAIIIDDDLTVLNVLRIYFELRKYEVITCSEPVRCPGYDDNKQCDNRRPCCDVLITDYRMPCVTGIDLLQAQSRMGCSLSARNKLIMSGTVDDKLIEAVKELGCSFLRKPFTFDELEVWLRQCEERMDLNQPLGLKRRELRESCCSSLCFLQGPENETLHATAVNRSRSGLCLKVRKAPLLHQILNLTDDLPTVSKCFVVRWSKAIGEGEYLVGLSCC